MSGVPFNDASSRRSFLKTVGLLGSGLGLMGVSLGDEVISQRRLRFRLQFSNPSARDLPTQYFWCYLPFQASGQRLETVKVSMPHEVLSDDDGHRILKLTLNGVHGYFQSTVSVDVVARHERFDHLPPLRDRSSWLQPQRFIESDHPLIQAQARVLQTDTDASTARAIYDWVIAHTQYAGYVADDLGALYALEHQQGDCTEYADLVVALARACQIPARMVGGYVAETDIAPKPRDYHNWAELWLDNRWQVVDAQKANFCPAPGSYVGFRIYRDGQQAIIGNVHRYRIQGELEVSF